MNRSNSGFTMLELMYVVAILAVVITGMMRLYIYTTTQSDMSGRKTIAISQAQNKMEEIRNHAYAQITTDYGGGGTPGNTFALNLINGMGVIYIDASNPELLELEVVVSWENKYDRIVGEDVDLDGVLDGGEDINGNGKLDSSVELVSYITRR